MKAKRLVLLAATGMTVLVSSMVFAAGATSGTDAGSTGAKATLGTTAGATVGGDTGGSAGGMSSSRSAQYLGFSREWPERNVKKRLRAP